MPALRPLTFYRFSARAMCTTPPARTHAYNWRQRVQTTRTTCTRRTCRDGKSNSAAKLEKNSQNWENPNKIENPSFPELTTQPSDGPWPSRVWREPRLLTTSHAPSAHQRIAPPLRYLVQGYEPKILRGNFEIPFDVRSVHSARWF